MRTIQHKLALVTGAASGIGRAISIELARHGANLILVDLNRPLLDVVLADVRAHRVDAAMFAADIGRPWDIERLVDTVLARWGGLDILVNNAGIAYYGLTEHMRDDQWDRLLAVNFIGPMLLTRRLLPALLTRPEPHVLNVCSLAGLVHAPRLTAYQVSKAGLIGFSESLRAEYGRRGLGVTALCPGPVRTNIFRAAEVSQGRKQPKIPNWLQSSPERVARRAVRAIRGRQGTVVVTLVDHVVWGLKRALPGTLDYVQQFRWRRPKIENTAPLVDLLAGAASSGGDGPAHPFALLDHDAA
jgi:NAD(P)-dependent dehydrogenase (short-subunit alcohol dehydrogenase family)